MQQSQHILVIRFSAMGDVAMTVPVIKAVLTQNPQVNITVVSNAFFQPLFEGIDRCHFYQANLKQQHKGIGGIFRLYKELKKNAQINAIADLHNVLRSSILKLFFRSGGYKIATIDKGRAEKKALTRKENKVFQPLTTTHERYADVFRQLGLVVDIKMQIPVFNKRRIPAAVATLLETGKKIIGIAPFAQYKEKMYPLEKMQAVVQLLVAENNSVLLFGGGEKESAVLQQWENDLENVHSVAGKFSFAEELAIISNLSTMVSMDSANMHLAALFGVPVVSIWGATHPYAGFTSWGLLPENIVQADLYCRPCSVFGNKPCYRGDHACMQMITRDIILEKITGMSDV
ncbi:glycosyltransferase family 9 protein [Ferruginibacter paludis]|uniref:glycosyltransferase family 9 protein n=1 Tax=Ferruginibacter paludis TaxID=1310417 RepID=UPI0025B53060|nr:glycosyltransferase family 9 protein [Ferruginibacter paludis]MDN3654151.1 glycosyltransferase family 9 protein [Ferruginibacter paludis]